VTGPQKATRLWHGLNDNHNTGLVKAS